MSEINKMKEQLAAKQKEVDTAKTKLENARRIIEKQGEIYRNLVVFKESVDSFAESRIRASIMNSRGFLEWNPAFKFSANRRNMSQHLQCRILKRAVSFWTASSN